jgi:matrixin
LKKIALGIIIVVLACQLQNSAFATSENILITAPWNSKSDTIKVAIINEAGLTENKISVVKRAIDSEISYNKGGHIYFEGWIAALESIAPTRNIEKFKILEYNSENNVNADITIKLLTTQDPNYSGFTKPTIIEDKMKQASIRIFDSNNITTIQLENLVRHEFGHALGLGHSTDQSSIMYELIESEPKLITDCDLSGLKGLSEGHVFTFEKCNQA